MTRTLIRYRTRPERTEENQRLIEAVFQELGVNAPAGIRYTALKLADGTFNHLVSIEAPGAELGLTQLPAFQSFQKEIRDRCVELPSPSEAIIVGNYRMFGW